MVPVRLEFNSLPEVTRRRFLDAAARAGLPGGALAFTRWQGAWRGWLALLVLAGFPFAMLSLNELTHLGHALTLGSSRMSEVLVFGALLLVVLLALLALLAPQGVQKGYPFRLGKYVFPTDIVVAEPNALLLYPLADLGHVSVTYLRGRRTLPSYIVKCDFAGGVRVELPFQTSDESFVRRLVDALQHGQRTVLAARAAGSFEPLRGLDPFFEAKMRSFAPVAEPGPTVGAPAAWTRYRVLIALVLTVVVTGGIIAVGLAVDAATPTPPRHSR